MEDAARKVMGRLNPKFQNFKVPVESLSGGQRQSVAIAKAVYFNASDPDHGRAHRSPGTGRDRASPPADATAQGGGYRIIMISHDIHDVFDLADRISVMLQGKLVGTVNKDDVTMDEVLAMIIIGKMPEEVTVKELEPTAEPVQHGRITFDSRGQTSAQELTDLVPAEYRIRGIG